MTPIECVDVVEFLAARCPAMRMHENTADAWYVDLAEHTKTDALEAVRRCSRGADFVSLHQIVDELGRIVRARVGAERRAQLERVIAAENPPGELQARPVAALTAGQTIPRDDPERIMRREQLRAAARTKRAQADADVAARTAAAERREQARREIDAIRAKHQAEAAADLACPRCRAAEQHAPLNDVGDCAVCGTSWRRGDVGQMVAASRGRGR